MKRACKLRVGRDEGWKDYVNNANLFTRLKLLKAFLMKCFSAFKKFLEEIRDRREVGA
jgi:hypothetical protein